MSLEAETVAIRPFTAQDAASLLELRVRNRDFFAPFEPAREPGFFTLDGQTAAIQTGLEAMQAGHGYPFVIVDRAAGGLLGWVKLSHVVRGAWQNAVLGYAVDQAATGRGCGGRRTSSPAAGCTTQEGSRPWWQSRPASSSGWRPTTCATTPASS